MRPLRVGLRVGSGAGSGDTGGVVEGDGLGAVVARPSGGGGMSGIDDEGVCATCDSVLISKETAAISESPGGVNSKICGADSVGLESVVLVGGDIVCFNLAFSCHMELNLTSCLQVTNSSSYRQ